MNVRSTLAAAVGVMALCATSACGAEANPVTPRETTPTAGVVTVDGRVSSTLNLSVEDLRRNYPGHAAAGEFKNGCVTQGHHYRGALFAEVLATAKPQFDPAIENVKLRYAILVGGADRYEAVLSWGEVDPHYANTQALLAYEQDGMLLARPHLIVPGDTRPGRYVCDVASISLQQVVR